MSEKLTLNPTMCIKWRAQPNGRFLLQNAATRKTFSVPSEFADLIFYCAEPRTLDKIRLKVKAVGECSDKEAHDIIKKLKSSGILSKPGLRSEYDLWLKRDWRVAMYFHLLTQGNTYADADEENAEANRSSTFKAYLKAEKMSDIFREYRNKTKLPPPSKEFVSMSKTMVERRTSRSFAQKALSQSQLSSILHYSCQPAKVVREYTIKNARKDPSAYAMSLFTPFEIYFVANNIKGLLPGLYHYNMSDHSVSLLKKGQFNKTCMEIAIGQPAVLNCSAVFFISARFVRYMWRYRHSRALRNLLIECSALGHRLILSATGLGLKNFLTPAMVDWRAEKFFGFDGINEAAIYVIGIGN